jgi:class 3 adenylate cyclase/tetratricopeptide (TPR) repeat protein
VRKTVTVIFCDVTGSTALGERLDPESLRRVMARYFDEMRAVVERHGGTVEKFIGDAVMAVFGVPVLHEDDALRAVRAAAEMRDALAELNEELERDWGLRIQVRTGVNTGEVVAGDASGGQRFATGDAVNVAKRFEEAAPAGEILLGEPTFRLVRDAVEVEPVQALELKGKGEPTPAYQLRSIEPGLAGRARRLDSPMVGRARERTVLRQAYERAVGERACHLFTILGAAGVGKSRLVAEFVDDLGGQPLVVSGRCLPYGEGITFWPLLEVLRTLFGEDELMPKIATRLADDENAALIANRVAAAVGLAESEGPGDETFWGVRKLFEALARDRPLVVVFDDVHWGEASFLDLVEHIADWSRDASILLACLARPELLDARPAWAGGKFNSTSVLLEPLDDDDSRRLIDNLLGRAELAEDVRLRVAAAAEGNPLFVEEMLSMLIDDGLLERRNGDWIATADLGDFSVPPTIQALLAARLERLAPAERAVAERASVEGKVFHRGAVVELSPNDARETVGERLQALVRKELVRPDHAQFAGEDAFRFRHLLIRDAAYGAMPKELRAELHEAFAAWLERAAGRRILEYEEILGYHLEQAYRFRVELAPVDDAARALADSAGERLASAGRRALSRGDAPAAVTLLERAGNLLTDGPGRAETLADLGEACRVGGDLAKADRALTEAIALAEDQDSRRLAMLARLRHTHVTLLRGSRGLFEPGQLAQEAIGVFEELDDDTGLAEAWHLSAQVQWWLGQATTGRRAFERALEYARRAGNTRAEFECLGWLAIDAYWGPAHLDEALAQCRRLLDEARGSPSAEAWIGAVLGALQAMGGSLDEGRAQFEVAVQRMEDIGLRVSAAAIPMMMARVDMAADAPARASEALHKSYVLLDGMGETSYRSTIAAMLALALCEEGRYDEAAPFAAEAQEIGAPDDFATQTYWRLAESDLAAKRGDVERGVELAREAVALLSGAELTSDYGAAVEQLGKALAAAGQVEEARAKLAEAVDVYERKGATVMSAAARRRLDVLPAA